MMRILDRKGRLFGKINIIDLTIILIIVLIAGAVYHVYFREDESAQVLAHRIEYDIELAARPETLVEVIAVGDNIWDSVRGHYLGTVVDKQVRPATKVSEDMVKGKYIVAKIPNMYDVIITLEANGRVTPYSILAEGIEVKVGQRIYVKGKGYASPGFIVGLRYDE